MTKEIAVQAMTLAEEIHSNNAIKIGGGKKYSKVIHRIEAFRRTVGYDYGIETNIQVLNGGYTAKAEIKDKDGRVIASGCSYADKLAKEKALEKLETTAIGRALANLGLGGDEYASLDEIESHEERYQPKAAPKQEPDPEVIMMDGPEFSMLLKEITDSETDKQINDAADKARAAWKRMLPAQRKTITPAIEKKRAELNTPAKTDNIVPMAAE